MTTQGTLDFGTQLKEETVAVRVRVSQLGIRRTMTDGQRQTAARAFDADENFVCGSKRLIDNKHPAYKAVMSVKNSARRYWTAVTVPYPESSIRLLRRSSVDSFNDQMQLFETELAAAASGLQERWEEIRHEAEDRLGTLFDAIDYPDDVASLFELGWDFPSVEPPDYLKDLNPALYEAQKARVVAKFNQAVQLAEEAFIAQFKSVVDHLCERLAPDEEGNQKTFRDTAIGNLRTFFEGFQELGIHSNEALDALVEQAKGLVEGQDAATLRKDAVSRQSVATGLSEVQAALDAMMIDSGRAVGMSDSDV